MTIINYWNLFFLKGWSVGMLNLMQQDEVNINEALMF